MAAIAVGILAPLLATVILVAYVRWDRRQQARAALAVEIEAILRREIERLQAEARWLAEFSADLERGWSDVVWLELDAHST